MDGYDSEASDREAEREYQRGVADVSYIQATTAVGSEEREAAYLAMELQWEREGFDG